MAVLVALTRQRYRCSRHDVSHQRAGSAETAVVLGIALYLSI